MAKLSPVALKWLALVLVVVGLTGTNVFLVMEGVADQTSQYMFSLVYCYYSIVFYGPLSWYMIGWKRMWPALRVLLDIKYSGLLGLCWTINYVFILVAIPYVANGEAVILSQMQTVLVWVINEWIYKLRVPWWKRGCILVTVAATIFALIEVNNAFKPSIALPRTRQVLVSLVYVVNAIANGFSNILLEGQYTVFWPPESLHVAVDTMQDVVVTGVEQQPLLSGGSPQPPPAAGVNAPPNALEEDDPFTAGRRRGDGHDDVTAHATADSVAAARARRAVRAPSAKLHGINKVEFAVLVNVAYNFWSVMTWLLFFWVGLIPNKGYIFSVDILSAGSGYFLLMSLSTYIYTIGVNILISFESSLYAAVVQQVPPLISNFILAQHFMGDYRQPQSTLGWIMVFAASIAGSAYSLANDDQNENVVRRTIFARMYAD